MWLFRLEPPSSVPHMCPPLSVRVFAAAQHRPTAAPSSRGIASSLSRRPQPPENTIPAGSQPAAATDTSVPGADKSQQQWTYIGTAIAFATSALLAASAACPASTASAASAAFASNPAVFAMLDKWQADAGQVVAVLNAAPGRQPSTWTLEDASDQTWQDRPRDRSVVRKTGLQFLKKWCVDSSLSVEDLTDGEKFP